mgnify:CR=1 FL=1
MSTIKVDTIATRTGSGNITLSNNVASLTSAGAISGTNITASGTLGVTGATSLAGTTVSSSTLNMSSSLMQFSGNISLPNVGACLFRPSADTIAFGINNGQRVSVNQHGLLFGTDTAAADALDDYEEGSWTPTTTNATGYSAQFGKYVKVGKLVFINGNLHTSTTSAPGAVIDGLPFASSNTGNSAGNLSIGYYSNIAQHVVWIGGYVLNNSTTMYIVGNSAGHTGTTLQRNGFNWASGNSRVMFSGVYETDA